MSDMELKPAIIYCRVSDGKGGKRGDGLRSQESTCREFARFSRYDVHAVFTDDITGEATERPGMTDLVKYLKRFRPVGYYVIIDSIDRFARDVRGHWDLRDLLREAGGKLISPKMEFKDDADSKMVENIHATFAQHFRERNAEQTLRRMRGRILGGYAVFNAPIGYKYKPVQGHGQMLKPDEPVASVIREALEGYASGRFESQADVGRFLQDHPLFPKDRRGLVHRQKVSELLGRSLYAGFVEAPQWGIPMREGHHEALISATTYQRIRERLEGRARAPHRTGLNEDFPLRGYVLCDDCGGPLTACWSTGNGRKRHPYYLCPKKGCESYGKSIRRDVIEGAFEEVLRSLTPSPVLFSIADKMFRKLWERQGAENKTQIKAMEAQVKRLDEQVSSLLDRIPDVSLPSVISALEERIGKLQDERTIAKMRIAESGQPKTNYETTLRTALGFLANPWILWASGQFDQRRTVIKLAFASPLRYARKIGFRTANLSLPFRVLGSFSGEGENLARPKRFELLTPRFVVWCKDLKCNGLSANRHHCRVLWINDLEGFCKP